ncbi:trans-L-3-hydroxyproline dehydratase [Aureococcus anophagefferens]|nr:trans-L-3-hydroxyproline dehydratase [Aureococcus anophagefferens]
MASSGPSIASIAAMRAQRRTVASFRGVSIASNAAMRAQRRAVASFRENFKLPARLWEQREVLRCVDLHCGGEPATVVFGGGGVADAPGATMFAKRAHVMERMDRWREVLLHEPRGYPCSNVDYLVEPTLAGADAGFVIAEQAKIYPLMSGHNTICVATALVECGALPEDRRASFLLEAPGGPIPIAADVAADGRCERVTFGGTPSFVGKRTRSHDSAPPRRGAAGDRGARRRRLRRHVVKAACRDQHPVDHPDFDYPGPDILAFRGPSATPGVDAKNTVVMSNGYSGMLDRSPCGSGTCAIMALLHERGELRIGEDFAHESVVGSIFTGRLAATTTVGGFPAVEPTIAGSAWITRYAEVVVDPTDPFPAGYRVADIW